MKTIGFGALLPIAKSTSTQIFCFGLFFSVVAVFTTSAAAGTCTASDTYAKACQGKSVCGALGLCSIAVTSSASGVDQDPVCVDPGTTILWYDSASNPNLYFKVIFSTSPFSDAKKVLTGSKVQGSVVMPSDIVSAAAIDCYQYAVRECTDAAMTNCTAYDPKVIVNGVKVHPDALH
jgi:hypothetical protein